jgi:hypothetical protein
MIDFQHGPPYINIYNIRSQQDRTANLTEGVPTVLGSAGMLFRCLEQATKEMDLLRRRQYTKFHFFKAYTVFRSLCYNENNWKGRYRLRTKEKVKRRTASFLLLPPSPYRPNLTKDV